MHYKHSRTSRAVSQSAFNTFNVSCCTQQIFLGHNEWARQHVMSWRARWNLSLCITPALSSIWQHCKLWWLSRDYDGILSELFLNCQCATSSMGTVNESSSYDPVRPWVSVLCFLGCMIYLYVFYVCMFFFCLGQLSYSPSCYGAGVTKL